MKSFVKAHVGRSAISRKEHAGSRETLAEAPEGWRVASKRGAVHTGAEGGSLVEPGGASGGSESRNYKGPGAGVLNERACGG